MLPMYSWNKIHTALSVLHTPSFILISLLLSSLLFSHSGVSLLLGTFYGGPVAGPALALRFLLPQIPLFHISFSSFESECHLQEAFPDHLRQNSSSCLVSIIRRLGYMVESLGKFKKKRQFFTQVPPYTN